LFNSIIDLILQMLDRINEMSIVPRVFYFLLLVLFGNIFIYRLILYPGLIYLFLTLCISEALRVAFNEFVVKYLIKADFKRDLSDILDPIAVFLLIIEIFLNARFKAITPLLLVFWTKPLSINYRLLTDNPFYIFIISFSKTILSLLICSISFVSMKLLNFSILPLTLELFDLSVLQNVLLFFFVVNIGLVILNLLPFPPFEMGIALEHLAPNSVRKFLMSIRPFGSLLILIFYYFNLIPYFLYAAYNFILNIISLFI